MRESNWSENATAAEERKPSINDQALRLREYVKEVSEELEALADVLADVLHEGTPETSGDAIAAVRQQHSPLHERLTETSFMVQRISERLRDLRRRVEL
jgi:predicted nuclease with TOPRIM domain